jgi:hypothetical protein
LASGTAPGAGTNIIDDGTTFGFLSLWNETIGDLGVDPDPTNAYSAVPADDGVDYATANGAGGYGATDLVLIAAETDLPTASPTLIASEPMTVYTVADSDDYTTGLVDTLYNFDFAGGSAQGWFANLQPDPTFDAMVTATDATAGQIGWSAAGTPTADAGYGSWFLSDNGLNAEFIIPGGPMASMEDRVYRAVMNLTSTAATRDLCCSYRMSAQSFQQVHWSGVQIITFTGGAEVDAPMTGADLGFEIHWAIPYDTNEWDDSGVLATTDWPNTPGFIGATTPADARNYCLVFDGIDSGVAYGGDSASLLMDSCLIQSYQRPADKATPDLEWGAAGIAFDSATDGYVTQTTTPFTVAALGTGSRTSASVTLTMGTVATNGAKWNQANQAPASVTQTYAEVANDLVRYTVTYSTPAPNTCPNVRFQTTPINSSGFGSDATIWYDNFVPTGVMAGVDPATDLAPGTPKTGLGSVVDVYRYTMNTSGSRFLHFYWDAYGMGAGLLPGTWAAQSGSVTVTSIVLNGGLTAPEN